MGRLSKFLTGTVQEVLGNKLSDVLTRAGGALVIAVGWDVLGWIWGLPVPILGILLFAAFVLTLRTSYYVVPPKKEGHPTAPHVGKEDDLTTILSEGLQNIVNGMTKFSSAKVSVDSVGKLVAAMKRAQKEFGENRLPIKIISLEEHLKLAKTLEDLFRTMDYDVLYDPASVSYIFRATRRHDRMKVSFREEENNWHSFACRQLITGLATFSPAFDIETLPQESGIDHLQIELGGAL